MEAQSAHHRTRSQSVGNTRALRSADRRDFRSGRKSYTASPLVSRFGIKRLGKYGVRAMAHRNVLLKQAKLCLRPVDSPGLSQPAPTRKNTARKSAPSKEPQELPSDQAEEEKEEPPRRSMILVKSGQSSQSSVESEEEDPQVQHKVLLSRKGKGSEAGWAVKPSPDGKNMPIKEPEGAKPPPIKIVLNADSSSGSDKSNSRWKITKNSSGDENPDSTIPENEFDGLIIRYSADGKLERLGDWQTHMSSKNLKYYYNRRTYDCQWQKPDIWLRYQLKEKERKHQLENSSGSSSKGTKGSSLSGNESETEKVDDMSNPSTPKDSVVSSSSVASNSAHASPCTSHASLEEAVGETEGPEAPVETDSNISDSKRGTKRPGEELESASEEEESPDTTEAEAPAPKSEVESPSVAAARARMKSKAKQSPFLKGKKRRRHVHGTKKKSASPAAAVSPPSAPTPKKQPTSRPASLSPGSKVEASRRSTRPKKKSRVLREAEASGSFVGDFDEVDAEEDTEMLAVPEHSPVKTETQAAPAKTPDDEETDGPRTPTKPPPPQSQGDESWKKLPKPLSSLLKENEGSQRHHIIGTLDDVLNLTIFGKHVVKPMKCHCTDHLTADSPTGTKDPLKCQAVDELDGVVVDCALPASDALATPWTSHPFRRLCSYHADRMKTHNCCPFCGIFCTQGTFVVCRAETGILHAFHEQCMMKFTRGKRNVSYRCPHCVEGSKFELVKLAFMYDPHSSVRHDRRIVIQSNPPVLPVRGKTDEPEILNAPKIPDDTATGIFYDSLPSSDSATKLRKAIDAIWKKPVQTKGPYSLYEAALVGNVEAVLRLLRSGVDVNERNDKESGRRAVHAAALAGHVDVLIILNKMKATLDLRDDVLCTPLMLAAAKDRVECIFYLVQNGCSVFLKGKDGKTPLHFAARNQCLKACQALISAVPNVQAVVNIQDDGGWTPMVWSAEFGSVPILQFFLSVGADAKMRDLEGNTALHWGAYSGRYKVVKTLLETGCPVDAQNFAGDTALHIAARREKSEAVLLLLHYGASWDVKNKAGETPRHCAAMLADTSSLHALIGLNAIINRNAFSMRDKTIIDGEHPETLRIPDEPAICQAAVEAFVDRDVSNGQEKYPISWVNTVDDTPIPSDEFRYTKSNVDLWMIMSKFTPGIDMKCRCRTSCLMNCSCSINPFCYDEFGRCVEEVLTAGNPLIVECGRTCGCDYMLCCNRVVQKGLGIPLQVFRTGKKGWGVRAVQGVPSRSFVCTYAGELLNKAEAVSRDDASYILDLPKFGNNMPICIDAKDYGNVGRFVNHSCDPNMKLVRVVDDVRDQKTPQAAFFTLKDIVAGEEITFDYGDSFWKRAPFPCACGSDKCRFKHMAVKKIEQDVKKVAGERES